MTCAVASSEDVVLKKMLYLYISTYAQANPDLTLLTINLLTKDCRDQDPTIRGLALRSLCQLRVANLVEYLVRAGRRRSAPCGSLGARRAPPGSPQSAHLQLCQACDYTSARLVSQSITSVTLQGATGTCRHVVCAAGGRNLCVGARARACTVVSARGRAQMSPIQQGLKDAHPYVRRTAVMGVLKVYHLDSAAVLNAGARAALLQATWLPHPCWSGRGRRSLSALAPATSTRRPDLCTWWQLRAVL